MHAPHRSIRLHPNTHLRRVKIWGPPCGLSTIAFCGYKAGSGEGTKRGTHPGHPTTSPPDNLPTAHSGLHSLGGSTSAISPSHLKGGY